LKVEVEGASRDAGARDDISDIGPMIAFAREYPLGVAQHLGAPSLSFHLRKSLGELDPIGPSGQCQTSSCA
jgi:hypothetical protein